MAIQKQQLLRILHDRNVFALAQHSYRQYIERKRWWAGLVPSKPDRKEDQRILEDQPPYPNITARLFPDLLAAAKLWGYITSVTIADHCPFLRYIGEGCCHPEHEEKDGLVYPLHDPFWHEWMPPNSFPCGCWVMSVSRSLLERRMGAGVPPWRVGVASSSFRYPHPDEGFNFNPGRLSIEPAEGQA